MANVLTNTGRTNIISLLYSALSGKSYIGWGIGAGTSAITDTTLFSEVASERTAATAAIITSTITGDTLQISATLTATSIETITNIGWFDASSGGNLFIKGDFTGVALNPGDKLFLMTKLLQQ